MSSLITPTGIDVLGGRGNGSNMHPGNINFRKLAANHKDTYHVASNEQKAFIKRQVVEQIHNGNGRFLNKNDDGVWEIMDEKYALKKTGQALRDVKVNTMSTQPINVSGLGVNPHASRLPADAPNNDQIALPSPVDTQYNPVSNNSLFLKDLKTENDETDWCSKSACNMLMESCQNVDIGLVGRGDDTYIDSMNDLNMSIHMSPRNTKASPDVSFSSPNMVSNFCNQPDNKVSPKKTFQFGHQPYNDQIIPPFHSDIGHDGTNKHKTDGMNQNLFTAQNDKSTIPWVTVPISSLSITTPTAFSEVPSNEHDRRFQAQIETISPNFHSNVEIKAGGTTSPAPYEIIQNVSTVQNNKSNVPWITAPTSSLVLDFHSERPKVLSDGPGHLFVAKNETVSPDYHSEGKINDKYDSFSGDMNEMSLTSLWTTNSGLSKSLHPVSNTDLDLSQTSISRSMNSMASAVFSMSITSLFNRSINAEDRLEEDKDYLTDESDEERSMDYNRSEIFDNLTGSSESGQAYPRGKSCANMRDMMARLQNKFITLSGKSANAFAEE